MKKIILLIFLFVVSLSVFIAINAPANILQKYTYGFKLHEKISRGFAIHEKIGKINWQLKYKYLLLGKLAFLIEVDNKINKLTTIASIDLFNNIELHNLTGKINIKYLRKFIKSIPDTLTANIKINNANIQINRKTLNYKSITGNIIAQKVNLLGEKIGNYSILIKSKNNEIVATIKNGDHAKFNSNILFKLQNKDIQITGNIKAKDSNSKKLLSSLGISEKINYKFKL